MNDVADEKISDDAGRYCRSWELPALPGPAMCPCFALRSSAGGPIRIARLLFHRGPLSDADREQLQPLEEQQDESLANVAVRTVDLDALDAETEEGAADKALLEALGEPKVPALVVQYPHN